METFISMQHPILNRPRGQDHGWHILHRPLGLVLIVLFKGLWGLTEFASGVLIFFSSKLIAKELLEDPQDLFFNWLLEHIDFTPKEVHYIGGLVMLLGIAKIVLAFGIWHRTYIVRNLGLIFFGLLGIFGAWHAVFSFSLFKLVALMMDIAILFYFWKILPKHFRHNEVS